MTKSSITIYHNPRCGKSRSALELLREKGVQPHIIEYLKDPPTKEILRAILRKLGMKPEQLVRKNEDKIAGWVFDNKDQLRLAVRITDNGTTEVLRGIIARGLGLR